MARYLVISTPGTYSAFLDMYKGPEFSTLEDAMDFVCNNFNLPGEPADSGFNDGDSVYIVEVVSALEIHFVPDVTETYNRAT